MGPCPIGRLDQGSYRLGVFSSQHRVEHGAREKQPIEIGRQGFRCKRQTAKQWFGTLSGKQAAEAQTGSQSFFDENRPFDRGQTVAAGIGERLPQFLQARILFALYNANRHWSDFSAADRPEVAPRLVLCYFPSLRHFFNREMR